VAKTNIILYLCPSNSILAADPFGYGQTDYMPTVYTDIDPDGLPFNASDVPLGPLMRDKWKRMDGLLHNGGSTVKECFDVPCGLNPAGSFWPLPSSTTTLLSTLSSATSPAGWACTGCWTPGSRPTTPG
jgi:hypothetical protein